MKRIGAIILCLCISIFDVSADGKEYFEFAKNLYNQGKYEEAIQGFKQCIQFYSDELDVSSMNNWIGKCQTKIKERNAQIRAQQRAKMVEAERQANAAKLAEEQKAYEARQKERIERKLLYVSSNAFLFDKEYAEMHQAIKGYVAEHSEQRFTDDPEMAYWSVYITANAYEYEHEHNSNNYFSYVVAYVKITNEITKEIIYENEIVVKGGSTILTEDSKKGYQLAAIMAYNRSKKNNVVNEVGAKILENLK